MLLTVLSILFLVALFIGLVMALLKWIMPSIRPMLTDVFGVPQAYPSAFEILRQRYASGEIDAVTFEQMWERLEASYRRVSNGVPVRDYNYQEEHLTGYGSTYTSPASYGQGKLRMAEQEQYRSETNS
jgi:hypothetical protein